MNERSPKPASPRPRETWENVKAAVKSTAREVQATLESTADVAVTTPPSTATPSGTSSVPGPWSSAAVAPELPVVERKEEPRAPPRPSARLAASERLAEATHGAALRVAEPGQPVEGWAAPEEAIDKLDQCLRGELSGVETYELALTRVTDPALAIELRRIRDSHADRAELLRARLRACGTEPSRSSGAWGAFATLVQRGADLFGDRAALAALEEGEAHGVKLYTEELSGLDARSYELVTTVLLPEQERTHALCRALGRFRKAA